MYYVKGEMNCESSNLIYSITCIKCLEQYVGSAIKFKCRFRFQKSGIKTKKDRCGTARHCNNKCCNSSNPFVYLRVQLIESIASMMIVILKIFYGIEKNIGSPNYL